jgi:hypothetical protein
VSSAIGPVFTYLLTNFATAVQAVDSTALIVDGPVPDYLPPPPAPIVFVGATSPLSAVAGDSTRNYIELGRLAVDEDFSIPCYIDAAASNNDQAGARNSALGAYNAIVHLIQSDMTLGGLLLSGRVAEVQDIQIIQTDGDEEANDGRRCLITFRIHCQNHYTP